MRKKCKFCKSTKVIIFAHRDYDLNLQWMKYNCATCGRFGCKVTRNTWLKTSMHITYVTNAEEQIFETIHTRYGGDIDLWAANIKNGGT